MTPKKLEAAQEFARSRNLPVLNNVLIPRTKGFVFLRHSLATSVKAVYDVTNTFVGGVPLLQDALFKGKLRCGTGRSMCRP